MFYLAYTALACNIGGGLARESNLEVDSILPVILVNLYVKSVSFSFRRLSLFYYMNYSNSSSSVNWLVLPWD